MKNLAAILLAASLTFVMGCLNVARAIDADEEIAKKVGKKYGFLVDAADILSIGTITTPSMPKFEIAKTAIWQVAEKLASEGWELMGAVSFTTKSYGSTTSIVNLEYIFRRPLKK